MNQYDFTIALVREAGEKLASMQSGTVGHKGSDERDVLTEADTALHMFMEERIRAAFPDDELYSEEGLTKDFSGRRIWMIDPVDGSANFSRSIPHYAVCAALVEDGIPTVGAVYNPVTRELFSFTKGGGAFLNGASIRVSAVLEPAQAQGIIVVGHQPPLWDWGAAVYRSFLEHLKKLKALGSSGLDLCFLAAGRADIVVYGTLTTRDAAAAIGIVREAGGEVYTPQGIPVELTGSRQTIIAAANPTLFQKVLPLVHKDLLPS